MNQEVYTENGKVQVTLLFTPPKEDAVNLPRYGSYVVGEGLKVHRRLVDAKNSWRNRGWTWKGGNPEALTYSGRRGQHVTKEAFILENVDGLWYNLYVIKAGLTEEELPWMKEYIITSYGKIPYTDHHRNNSYYKNKVDSGEWKVKKYPTPMTRDEYVEWRLAIAKEQYIKESDF